MLHAYCYVIGHFHCYSQDTAASHYYIAKAAPSLNSRPRHVRRRVSATPAYAITTGGYENCCQVIVIVSSAVTH